MSAKMGILGESDSITAETTTVYTVPADKGAHCRLSFMVEHAGGVRPFGIQMGASSNLLFNSSSSGDRFIGYDPGTEVSPQTGGPNLYVDSTMLELNTQLSNSPFVVPFGDYYLSTTDTCKCKKGGGSQVIQMLIQCMGVEDDV